MRFLALLSLFYCLLLCFSVSAIAQEEVAVAVQGHHYIDLKIKSLNKLNTRLERQQKYLLKKLKKQEQRFASKLKEKDSLAYARLNHQPLTYDSIEKLSQPDSAMLAKTAVHRKCFER